jgi:hypothetical protein
MTASIDLVDETQSINIPAITVSTQNAIGGLCLDGCLTGIEPTTGPDGTQRWSCEGFCGCSLIWTKPEDFGHGTCDNSLFEED